MSRCVESLNPHRTWSQPKASLVYGIFLLETLQTALSGADIYYWFASGFGNMLHLGNPYISPFDTPVLCSLIALLVQGFFCYRIWLFNKSARWLSGLIGCVSVHSSLCWHLLNFVTLQISTIQCGAGIAGGVYVGSLNSEIIISSFIMNVQVHIHKSFTALPHDKQFILFVRGPTAIITILLILPSSYGLSVLPLPILWSRSQWSSWYELQYFLWSGFSPQSYKLLRHLTHDQRFTNNVLMRSVRLIVETNSLTGAHDWSMTCSLRPTWDFLQLD